jgi:hypothetical protein
MESLLVLDGAVEGYDLSPGPELIGSPPAPRTDASAAVSFTASAPLTVTLK